MRLSPYASPSFRLSPLAWLPSLLIVLILSPILNSDGPSLSDDTIHVVLQGDHADPTIVRDGDTFYLTYSSYTKYPGLKIWESTNLVDWKPIAYALHEDVGSVWAPEFIKHDDLFYIYFPTSEGKNYVTTAKSPQGPWSKPVELEVSGIDPGHISDPEGNRSIYLNGGKYALLSQDGLSVTKDAVNKYPGWKYPEEWEVECFCLESPKLIFKDGYYYLTSAQGGTAGPATSHMVVSARSLSPEGPWEESPHNPIVHTYSSEETLWSKGHGTVFDDADGNWYLIYHAYQKGALPFGRHILVEAVEWTKDGWYKTKRNPRRESKIVYHNNERIQSDDFDGPDLDLQWQLTGVDESSDAYSFTKDGLRLRGHSERLRTLQVNPDEKNFEAIAELEVEGDNTEAGLVIYYNDAHYTGGGVRGNVFHRVVHGNGRADNAIDVASMRYLKIRVRDLTLSLFFSADGESWKKYDRSYELSGYHHNALGGFHYLRPAIYIKGPGSVTVKSFQYHALR